MRWMIQPLMFDAEYEETMSALLAVIKQEDDDSSAQGDEVHRPEKPEAVKRIEDLHGLHCPLAEHFNQASARSSLRQPPCNSFTTPMASAKLSCRSHLIHTLNPLWKILNLRCTTNMSFLHTKRVQRTWMEHPLCSNPSCKQCRGKL